MDFDIKVKLPPKKAQEASETAKAILNIIPTIKYRKL